MIYFPNKGNLQLNIAHHLIEIFCKQLQVQYQSCHRDVSEIS